MKPLRAVAYLAGVSLLALLTLLTIREWRRRSSPQLDGFAAANHPWTAIGGAWSRNNETMSNTSDERGAKLMSGSPHWENYTAEADIALLGTYGDAGLLVRARDVEEGVDSYRGFFAGIRNQDNTLILGRSDYGWEEYDARPLNLQVTPGRFYHVRVTAVDCTIAAAVTTPEGVTRRTGVELSGCMRSGQVGLQSYQTPALWKNFHVQPATRADLERTLGGEELKSEAKGTLHAGLGSYQHQAMEQDAENHRTEGPATPLSQLRLLSPATTTRISVRGVVRLLSPIVFVEDPSDGIAVTACDTSAMTIGDEVEITGLVSQTAGRPILKAEHVKVLWSNSTVPATRITAYEAAAGREDAHLATLEGTLLRRWKDASARDVLEFASVGEVFRAVSQNRGYGAELPSLQPRSEVQLTGVVSTDPLYAGDSAFAVLLVPSQDAVRVLKTAPFWTVAHSILLSLLIVVLVAAALYFLHRLKERSLLLILAERELLAHDLHDTVSQSFAGIGYQLRALQDSLPAGPAPHAQLSKAQTMVRESHEELRRSITTLRTDVDNLTNLADGLRRCAERLAAGGDLVVQCSCEGVPQRIPIRVADCVFRVGQEALSNAVLHSGASRIEIQLIIRRRRLTLLVHDNGCGLAPGAKQSGSGLFGMSKRAEMIGAQLKLESDQGGTTVRLDFHLPATSSLPGFSSRRRFFRTRKKVS